MSSLRLKHINLVDGFVFQDGREVRIKNVQNDHDVVFPDASRLSGMFHFDWMVYLRPPTRSFGQEDALFPKPERRLVNGKFVFDRLSRETYANGATVIKVFRTAFEQVRCIPMERTASARPWAKS